MKSKLNGVCTVNSMPSRTPPGVFTKFVTVKTSSGVTPTGSSEFGKPDCEYGIVRTRRCVKLSMFLRKSATEKSASS